MNVIQEIKDLKRRFNFLRKSYETYEEPQHEVKRYKALLTQAGTNAPTAIVLENTFGEIPVWSYDDVGSYNLTFIKDVFINKTFLNCSIYVSSGDMIALLAQKITTKVYNLSVYLILDSSKLDDVLYYTPLTIEVYP